MEYLSPGCQSCDRRFRDLTVFETQRNPPNSFIFLKFNIAARQETTLANCYLTWFLSNGYYGESNLPYPIILSIVSNFVRTQNLDSPTNHNAIDVLS